jgi:hypothetical protein
VGETVSGRRFLIEDGNDKLHVVVVKGRPYEMGYAYGKLMASEI